MQANVWERLADGRARLLAWLGGPLLARELGERPLRWVAASTLLTSLLVGGHLLHLVELWKTQSKNGWLSWSDRAFLFWGWDSFGGLLSLHLWAILAVAVLMVAPTLSFMTVQRELRSRTMDSLLISPMGAGALHRGLALGSLAKVGPWVLPVALVLVAMAPLGALSLSTVAFSLLLLLVGGAALCSLGAALGVLTRRLSLGPLSGLLFFVGLAMWMGLLIGPALRGFSMVAGLSPAAATLHTLMADGNPWLYHNNESLDILQVSRLWGLPVPPEAVTMLVMGAVWWISHHVSLRQLRDPVAPPVHWAAALGSTLLVSLVIATGCAEELPYMHTPRPQDLDWFQIMVRSETALLMGLSNLLVLPWAFLMMLGVLPSREATERMTLWALTRPSDPPRGEQRANLPTLVALLATPLLVSMVMPWFVSMPYEYTPMTLGLRWLAVLPYAWGLACVLGAVSVWRLSQRKPWQTALMLVGVASSALLGVVYASVISYTPGGSWTIIHDVPLLELMEWAVLGVFLVLPLLLLGWSLRRRADFAQHVQAHAKRCAPGQEEPRDPFAWPPPQEAAQPLMCPLRQAQAPRARRWWSPKVQPRAAERWLRLDQDQLGLRQGAPGQQEPTGQSVDLARPFTVQVALQPRERFGHGQVLLNVVLSQRQGSDWARVGFAVPARYAGALDQLPVQEQRLDALGPRDVQPVLAALRHFAQVHGVSLPLV